MPDTNDEKALEARASVKRNRALKYAWSVGLIPPSVVAYFVLNFETFVRITSLVTLVLSVIALSIGQHAAQKADEARQAGYENP